MSGPTVAEMALTVAGELEDESRWTSEAMARDSRGNALSYGDPEAVRLCVNGHGYRRCGQRWNLVREAYMARFGHGTTAANDSGGREHVRARLLELAEASA